MPAPPPAAGRRHLAPPVVIVTGLAQEAALIAGRGWITLIGAGDADTLEREVRAAAPGASGLLSFGLAGGLLPGLPAGSLVLGETIVADGGVWPTDGGWTAALAARLPAARRVTVAAGAAIIDHVAGKAALHAATGAAVVDTESQIVARVGRDHGRPVAVVRAVCDPADMALPPAALVPLSRDGRPRLTAILASLAGQPRQLPDLLRLAGHSRAAFAALGRAATAIVPPPVLPAP